MRNDSAWPHDYAEGTLSFHGASFTRADMDAAAGQYVVGIIAADLTGNSTQSYAR